MVSVIVSGARTPIGRLLGGLSSLSGADLGGIAIAGALDRAGVAASDVPFLRGDKTVGQTLADLKGGREGRFFVAGTPSVVADEIERWLDEDGVDGINLRQYHSFDTARDFAELVVPELRRRGRITDAPATTLRNRLFGRGDRLPATHQATRYAGGANL